MPLFEFHRAAREKLHSTQSKMTTYTSDISSSVPDDEFVELLWENGQIVMQGQSSKPKTSSHSKVEDKDHRDPTIQKLSHFEKFDSAVSEISPAVPCSDIGSYAQDDDDGMAPWITNPMEDPFSSEFFSEFVGINPNPTSIERNNGHSSKALRECSGLSKIGGNQCQSSAVNNAMSRMSGFGADDDHFQKQDSVSASKPLGASNGVGVMNFANFSRPASLARASSESLHRLKMNEKVSLASASTNPTESTLLQSSGARGNLALDLQSKVNNHNNTSLVANNRSISSDRRINHLSSRFAASNPVAEKGPEAAVASSMCSGNSAGAASSDHKNRAKRKDREGEELGYHSEDLDDDGSKKPVTGRGGSSTKRTRAAEVHNLSERRRRDRINEKMRALQELIPNCNKVDKASMLDEAIEYLKTLQLQVQMMSMGNGLCMPPMMLPSRMQHLGAHPMAHFSPMGAGMGMGMGMSYGMGMLDMNGSPNFPVIPVPSMHTPQFSYSSIPGTSGFQMPGSMGVPLFGIPGHGQGILPVQDSNTEATMDQLRTSREN